jgi:excinuclease UvrABC nuclease subunit
MVQAASDLEFEKAAKLRDRIALLTGQQNAGRPAAGTSSSAAVRRGPRRRRRR